MAASPAARPGRRPAPKKAQLRVVRSDDRVPTVGAISSAVAGFFFIVMFALAGLHAVVVQTQAELDGINGDIAGLEEHRVNTLADLAWSESAVGVAVTAQAAGYVLAADVVVLGPIAPGQLTGPVGADPFAADANASNTLASNTIAGGAAG